MGMMSDSEFKSYCDRQKLPLAGIEYVAKARLGPPSRRPVSRVGNVTGRYISLKMHFTRDYESFRAERLCLLTLERDRDVLEFYTQAPPIPLAFTTQHGKRKYSKPDHVPDVLVLWKDRLELIEVKPFKVLQRTVETGSSRFKLTGGRWSSPPGEESAARLGLGYSVWWPESLPGLLPQNFDYLDPVVKMQLEEIFQGDVSSILGVVADNPGITLQELEAKLTKPAALAAQWLIGNSLIYCDLERTLLAEKHRAKLFIDESTARIFEAVFGNASEGGENLGRPAPSAVSSTTAMLLGSSKLDRELTVARLEASSKDPSNLEVSDRQLRRIKQKMRLEERAGNSPLMGMMARVSARGNHSPRISKEVEDVVRTVIGEKYANDASPVPKFVWHLARAELQKRKLIVPGTKWFYSFLKKVRTLGMEEKRKGTKAVYFDSFVGAGIAGVSDSAGAYPFDRVHIDHTQLEIIVIDEESKMCLKRPWLSLMLDAYTGLPVAYYLSFSRPSVDSLVMLFRDFVRRYQTIPRLVVTDNGADFHSKWYELFLASFRSEPVRRPPSKPRFGAIIERMFGIITTTLLYSLLGNTKRLRTARELLAKDHPAKDAIWTLDALDDALEGLIKLRGERMVPHLGRTPFECIQSYFKDDPQSLLRARKYDHDFYLHTLVATPKGTVRVQRGFGVKFRGIYYCNSALDGLVNQDLRILYDPDDVTTVYLETDKAWVPATCKYREKLQYYSYRELARYSKIFWRRWNQSQEFNVSKDDQIAVFIDSIQTEQEVKMDKMCDAAEKKAVAEEILSEATQAGLREAEAKLNALKPTSDTPKTESSEADPYDLLNGKTFEEVSTSSKEQK